MSDQKEWPELMKQLQACLQTMQVHSDRWMTQQYGGYCANRHQAVEFSDGEDGCPMCRMVASVDFFRGSREAADLTRNKMQRERDVAIADRDVALDKLSALAEELSALRHLLSGVEKERDEARVQLRHGCPDCYQRLLSVKDDPAKAEV